MNWKDYIATDPGVLVGKPCIKGTRISVELILEWFANGWSMEDILEAYPHLSQDQVLAALRFVSEIYKKNAFIAAAKCST